jgi:hypothetical protein
MSNKRQIHLHVDEWMKEYLDEASKQTKRPVSELLRAFTALTIIELSKTSGYKTEMDTERFYKTLKKTPSLALAHKIFDQIMHEGRKAVEFRFKKDLILKINED